MSKEEEFVPFDASDGMKYYIKCFDSYSGPCFYYEYSSGIFRNHKFASLGDDSNSLMEHLMSIRDTVHALGCIFSSVPYLKMEVSFWIGCKLFWSMLFNKENGIYKSVIIYKENIGLSYFLCCIKYLKEQGIKENIERYIPVYCSDVYSVIHDLESFKYQREMTLDRFKDIYMDLSSGIRSKDSGVMKINPKRMIIA